MTETAYDYDVLAIRRRLGADRWSPPRTGPGPTGVHFIRYDSCRTLIITSSDVAPIADIAGQHAGVVWLHASIAVQPDGPEVPSYAELAEVHRAVWGDHGWAFQVFAPPAHHVNIRGNALHLWGRLDGTRIHPDFGWAGTI